MQREQAIALEQNPLWDEVKKELDMRIGLCSRTLRTCHPNELRELQMKIAMYEELKNFPQQIKDREE